VKNLLIILLALPFSTYAQRAVQSQFVYVGLSYFPNSFDRLSPIIGFYQVDQKNNINDFQFNEINFSKRPGITASSMSLSYHKIIGLNKKSTSKFYLGLGLGASLYFNQTARQPKTSTSFPSANTELGSVLSIRPVINYSFTERFFLGLSANIGLLDQSIASSRYENPAIPINQQKQTQILIDVYHPNYTSFNLILGFKIN